MSVKKKKEITVPIPARTCYEIIRDAGNNIGWRLVRESKSDLAIKWQQGGGLLKTKLFISAYLKPLDQETHITLYGEIPGIPIFDGPGHIPKAWEKLLVPFGNIVDEVAKELAAENDRIISSAIEDGLMCPKCGKRLPPGTHFCPNDGTEILAKCSNCGEGNVPSARFCSSCGNKL
jgi:hypothetical protein